MPLRKPVTKCLQFTASLKLEGDAQKRDYTCPVVIAALPGVLVTAAPVAPPSVPRLTLVEWSAVYGLTLTR